MQRYWNVKTCSIHNYHCSTKVTSTYVSVIRMSSKLFMSQLLFGLACECTLPVHRAASTWRKPVFWNTLQLPLTRVLETSVLWSKHLVSSGIRVSSRTVCTEFDQDLSSPAHHNAGHFVLKLSYRQNRQAGRQVVTCNQVRRFDPLCSCALWRHTGALTLTLRQSEVSVPASFKVCGGWNTFRD